MMPNCDIRVINEEIVTLAAGREITRLLQWCRHEQASYSAYAALTWRIIMIQGLQIYTSEAPSASSLLVHPTCSVVLRKHPQLPARCLT
jgi:hypothetical protein